MLHAALYDNETMSSGDVWHGVVLNGRSFSPETLETHEIMVSVVALVTAKLVDIVFLFIGWLGVGVLNGNVTFVRRLDGGTQDDDDGRGRGSPIDGHARRPCRGLSASSTGSVV